MSMSPNTVTSWGLWASGGLTSEKHACAGASWGLELTLPARAAVKVIMLPDGRLVLQIGTFYIGVS
jgi:hypothetical protein